MKSNPMDFRSDTVTLPTPRMKEAIYKADLGDDVYQEDPTVKELEELACEIFAKEASLFFPTGTMANQAAVLAHTDRGNEVIVEENSHIYLYEVGGLAVLAGVQPRGVRSTGGNILPETVEKAIRAENIHFPTTGLICLENTHSIHGGTVVNKANIKEIAEVAKKYNIPVHMDGARDFTAAAFLNKPVKELSRDCNSIMFSLSKGLCAPSGSMLVGSEEFIAKARKCRKLLGGGMRQAGILAAAGIIALEEMPKRLNEDHENARILAEGLAGIKGIELDLDSVQTNIVRFKLKNSRVGIYELLNKLEEENIKIQFTGGNNIRMVTHKDISRDDVKKCLNVLDMFLK